MDLNLSDVERAKPSRCSHDIRHDIIKAAIMFIESIVTEQHTFYMKHVWVIMDNRINSLIWIHRHIP